MRLPEWPKIEKGVPIPPHKLLPDAPTFKRFLLELQVGDSFVLPDGVWQKKGSSLSQTTRETGRKFSTRLLEDGSKRVWRTS